MAPETTDHKFRLCLRKRHYSDSNTITTILMICILAEYRSYSQTHTFEITHIGDRPTESHPLSECGVTEAHTMHGSREDEKNTQRVTYNVYATNSVADRDTFFLSLLLFSLKQQHPNTDCLTFFIPIVSLSIYLPFALITYTVYFFAIFTSVAATAAAVTVVKLTAIQMH